MLQVLVIGVGNMGGALVTGLCQEKIYNVRAYDTHIKKLSDLSRLHHGLTCLDDLGDQPLEDDVVIICVKPQDLLTVAEKLKPLLRPSTILVSMLAGITIEGITHTCNHHGPIVRVMSNIAATVKEASTVIAAQHLTDSQKKTVTQIFTSIGEVDWAKESHLDAVTGLSGSGPAYVYMVIEALTDGGVKMGLTRALASNLAVQTVLGAAKLVKETKEHPAVLKDHVTTPGGTTIHALHELETRGLRAMLIQAVETATLKSADLRKKASS